MTRHTKAILFLSIGQVLCLACGLWISDKFSSPSLNSGPLEGSTVSTSSAGAVTAHQLVPKILTVLWIGGLQAGVAYLAITRLRKETEQNDVQSSMQILHREKDLVRTRNAVIFGLAKLAEHRDQETGQHLERIALYSKCLASALRNEAKYREIVSASFVRLIGISSVLHDIGKVAVTDAILRKPGPLDDDERKKMQVHARIGADCIREIERQLGRCNFLNMARDIAQCHHERWNGEGYPRGVSGESIPLAARIVSVVDVYDALASKRVYKDAFSHKKCIEIIAESAGTQFDPEIVEVFLRVASQFQQIARRFNDNQSGSSSSGQPTTRSTDQLITSLLEQDEPSKQLSTVT